MRTHSEIVRDATAAKLSELTGSPITTVRSWQQRDSIPPDSWAIIIDNKLATADELIEAAAAKRAAA